MWEAREATWSESARARGGCKFAWAPLPRARGPRGAHTSAPRADPSRASPPQVVKAERGEAPLGELEQMEDLVPHPHAKKHTEAVLGELEQKEASKEKEGKGGKRPDAADSTGSEPDPPRG